MQTEFEVYDSAKRPHPLVEEFLAVIKYRDLIVQFVSRSLKTRYKRSVLGVVWTMLNPLLTMVVLTLVFSSFFKSAIQNYPIYILCGLAFWGFVSNTTREAMGEMIFSGSLLNRIYVPKSVFAISAQGTALVNLFIGIATILVISLVLRQPLGWSILVLPASILLMVMFCLGVGLLLSAAAVYFADILPVYDVLLTIWFYSTPILYPASIIPERWAWVFKLNPLFHLIQLFRDPIFSGFIPGWQVWFYSAVFSIGAFVVGGLIFTWKSNEYAYRI
jgi:ABC-2 type transport system permease protein